MQGCVLCWVNHLLLYRIHLQSASAGHQLPTQHQHMAQGCSAAHTTSYSTLPASLPAKPLTVLLSLVWSAPEHFMPPMPLDQRQSSHGCASACRHSRAS